MCTGISYQTSDLQEFFGRTQEYDVDYDYIGLQFPRNYAVPVEMFSWVNSYSVMGIGTRSQDQVLPTVIDGVNEHGLAASTQYFADEFNYSNREEIIASGKNPVYAEQFIFYLLGNCRNLAEVESLLPSLAIPNESLIKEGGLPQHFFIKDLSGASLVIEPSLKLTFQVFKNPIGVMTNGPSFDWHLTNLRNYPNLTKTNKAALELGKTTISSFGKGSGLIGLPGDFTSPARFVRAATLLNLSQTVTNQTGPNLGFHILGTVDIPKGVVTNGSSVQYTQYTSIYNITKKELYLKLYDNLTIQKITYQEQYANSRTPKVYDLQTEPNYAELA